MTDIQQIAETVEGISVSVKGRFSALENEVLQMKRAGRIAFNAENGGPETKAMMSWLRSGKDETKALSVTSDGQGVTVRADWSDQIFSLMRESSPMRAIANVLPTSKNEVEVLVDREDAGSDWIAEVGTRVATTEPFMTRHKIAVHEHYALPAATLDMLDDSDFPVETWLQAKVADRFARQEASAFLTGDGSGQPKGILDYSTVPDASFSWGADPAAYTIGAVYTGAGGLGGAADAVDLISDLVDSLKTPYLPNASFLMTRAMRNQLRKLKDTENRSLYFQSLDAALPDRLMGYPVRLAEDMPAPGADVVGILFGDFRQAYTIADRSGVAVIRDVYSTPGFVRWYVRRRVGGALTNPEAVKAMVLGAEPA